jgi:hypothetical protein
MCALLIAGKSSGYVRLVTLTGMIAKHGVVFDAAVAFFINLRDQAYARWMNTNHLILGRVRA